MREVIGPALNSRDRAIKRALDRVRAQCDNDAARARDPVGVVHAYEALEDREIVALIAASVAFGNVKAIRAKLEDALKRLGPRPAQVADDELEVFARMHGWVHRVYRGEDLARLIIGARRIQRSSGSLGERFAAELEFVGAISAMSGSDRTATLREALARWCDAIREAGGLPLPKSSPMFRAMPATHLRSVSNRTPVATLRRGPAHVLPDPRGSSGAKRLHLYLRWMIRPRDGVDLGLWRHVDPSILLCPVDTHIHKLSRNLGLTRRKDLSWKTAEEITRGLARFDAKDPVKYDFSLCHMGMLQRCPSKRDAKRCEGCGVKPVCRHWADASSTRTGEKRRSEGASSSSTSIT